MIGTIDEIRIEGEENGFHLVIFTDDGETHRYRIGLPDQFRTETERTIGNWLYEGEAARATMPTSDDEVQGIEITNPKHPEYHEIVAGQYDNREGK